VRSVAASPLDRYFEAVDAGDADAATAAFTEDATYIRPSLQVPGALEIVRGRAELTEFFRKRGKLPFRHEVRICSVDGPECFVEGVAFVEAEAEPSYSFLAHATFDEEGRIRRYFALMSDAPDDLDSA
jgi:ketosteroid isomerase-like protein